MFTGIVKGRGRILGIQKARGGARRLEIRLPAGMKKASRGSSLALDGVCLTVEKLRGRKAGFFVSPQTLSVTTLGGLAPGSRVNVEPSLRWGDPLDGHLVQGHVEGRAALAVRARKGGSLELEFDFPRALVRRLIPKGSVALAGVSLTVASRRGRRARFALIPETLRRTTLGGLAIGAEVNVETDFLMRVRTSTSAAEARRRRRTK